MKTKQLSNFNNLFQMQGKRIALQPAKHIEILLFLVVWNMLHNEWHYFVFQSMLSQRFNIHAL